MAKKPDVKPAAAWSPPAEGGRYVVENGVLRRVEEPTKSHPEGNTNRDAEGRAIDYAGQPVNGAPVASAPAATETKE
jgi:hypothetical protein